MKIGFNLLLWTGHVPKENFPLFRKLKAVGYDGVEIPIFDTSDPNHFKKIGASLRDNGLETTAVTVSPDEEHNPISPVAKNRKGGLDHLKRVIECGHNAGIKLLCGPYYQVLGVFSGKGPTADEMKRAADVHRPLAEIAQKAGILLAIEPLNRFESYFLNTMAQAAGFDLDTIFQIYGIQNVDILKMDIEGGEFFVFPEVAKALAGKVKKVMLSLHGKLFSDSDFASLAPRLIAATDAFPQKFDLHGKPWVWDEDRKKELRTKYTEIILS